MKDTNTWRLNNMILNNQEVTKEIKEKLQNTEANDSVNMVTQTYDVSLNHFVIEFLKNWSEFAQNWLGIFINIFNE